MTDPHAPKPRRSRKPEPQPEPVAAVDTARNGQAKVGTSHLEVPQIEGKSMGYALARSELEPETRHAVLAMNASADLFGGEKAGVADVGSAIRDMAAEAAKQDMAGINRLLTAQALSLDALFTQLARKANLNFGSYPDAADRYFRLALKAQAQSRTTLETLIKLHQPREQTVRHVHVGPDGQAVFIENLHGGPANVRSNEQPHAITADAAVAALRGPDPLGTALPFAGHAERPLPHAWGHVIGSADWQPERMEARGPVGGVPGAAADGERP